MYVQNFPLNISYEDFDLQAALGREYGGDAGSIAKDMCSHRTWILERMGRVIHRIMEEITG